jgi:hypothetical protein
MRLDWSGRLKLFGRNFGRIFSRGKVQPVEIVRFNSHKFSSERFRLYAKSKIRLLNQLGVSKKDSRKVAEIATFTKVGLLAQQGQVISLKSAIRIQKFFYSNRDLLIDAYSKMENVENVEKGKQRKTSPKAIKIIYSIIKDVDSSVLRKKKPDREYNVGVMERVDSLLLSKKPIRPQPIIMSRLALVFLSELEEIYINHLGVNKKKYEELDEVLACNAFGEGQEVLM